MQDNVTLEIQQLIQSAARKRQPQGVIAWSVATVTAFVVGSLMGYDAGANVSLAERLELEPAPMSMGRFEPVYYIAADNLPTLPEIEVYLAPEIRA